MEKINWFPGHMAKASRLIESNLRLCDLVIYVLDSRAPKSCLNPSFNKLISDKPVIYALNKADLGSQSAITLWLNKLSNGKARAVSLDSTAANASKRIVSFALELCSDKLKKYQEKGLKISVRAMVIGIPNSGKSTLINNLCRGAKTQTGNKPGVTRGVQWLRAASNLEVMDTPGVLAPKLSDQGIARRLSYIGSIKDTILDSYELALDFIEEINLLDKNILKNRYEINPDDNADKILADIAKKRGDIIKGGEYDLERTALAVLDDFRKGRLGRITLELPSD